MRNIIRIFASDAKRLATNVVAMVVIMGLTVIPCLYAWFNIMSNWDPYGPDATKNLSVAVASSDIGVEVGGVEVNVGNLIINNLKTNKSIGWVFTDTSEEAIEGVHSGDYYAALVMDEHFSEDMLSFLGGDVEHPKIIYYENEKKNAIAPKITGKVKTTVQEEVNSAFVSTMAQTLLEISDYMVSTDSGQSLTGSALAKMYSLDNDLKTYITILDSYISLIDSTQQLMNTTKLISEELDSLTATSRDVVTNAAATADAANTVASAASDLTTDSLDSVVDNLQKTNEFIKTVAENPTMGTTQIKDLTDKLEQSGVDTSGLKDELDKLQADASDVNTNANVNVNQLLADQVLQTAVNYYDKYNTTNGVAIGKYDGDSGDDPNSNFKIKELNNQIINEESGYTDDSNLKQKYDNRDNKEENVLETTDYFIYKYTDENSKDKYFLLYKTSEFGQLYAAVKDVDEKATANEDELKDLWSNVSDKLDTCLTSVDTLNKQYQNVVAPQMNQTMNSIQASIIEAQKLVNSSGGNIMEVAGSLNSYSAMMALGKNGLSESKAQAEDLESKLASLISDMETLQGNDQYSMLMSLIETDPEVIADFISSPINLDSEPVYEIANNGSATAPFYIVLSIWVGALILAALLNTQIEKPIPGVKRLLTYEKFFGRYGVFFVVGQIQTLITVLGALFYVKIQCRHAFLFWLACAVCSLAFTLLLYALTFAFGNVGQAIAVVLMVIQVAGSGGTFPVEVLPKVYQVLYKYMPFAYGMNAVRETIGGMYKNDYWIYLSGMGVYIAIALVLGLVISIPCKKLNKMIDKSKENTDLMI